MPDVVRVVISGRVQGVGYRAWAVRTASGFKLNGWVRNRSDGTVEAVFAGEATAIASMLEACKSGPMAARVDAIERFAWNELVNNGFIARPTL